LTRTYTQIVGAALNTGQLIRTLILGISEVEDARERLVEADMLENQIKSAKFQSA
jgi:hypothetical protein